MVLCWILIRLLNPLGFESRNPPSEHIHRRSTRIKKEDEEMAFKWDWEKKELVEGEPPEKELPVWGELLILPACVGIGWWFIQYVAPWLGHLLLGGFL